jgi:hypothetical protein
MYGSGRFAPVTTSFFQQSEWLLLPPKRTKLIASIDRLKSQPNADIKRKKKYATIGTKLCVLAHPLSY